MVEEYVNLFHGTSYDWLEDIEENGIRSQASQGIISEAQEGLIRHETVYLYDPAELSEFNRKELDQVYVECEVPKENVYVTKYGCGSIENLDVEELDDVALSYEEFENGENPYLDSTSLMFLSTEDIPWEDIVALKWSL